MTKGVQIIEGLLWRKTFKGENIHEFVVFESHTKVSSLNLGIPHSTIDSFKHSSRTLLTDPQKFSPLKVSRYTVLASCDSCDPCFAEIVILLYEKYFQKVSVSLCVWLVRTVGLCVETRWSWRCIQCHEAHSTLHMGPAMAATERKSLVPVSNWHSIRARISPSHLQAGLSSL